MLYIVCKIRY